MNDIILPPDTNYIAVFLTLRCNLNCSYCINKHDSFTVPQELSVEDWITGLSRLQTRPDLPITLQGGEPTIYNGFNKLVRVLHFQHHKHLDLLTNGMFDIRDFCRENSPDTFKRNAKYASIRFSYHHKMSPIALVLKVWTMQNMGYEVGIWGLSNNPQNGAVKALCQQLNIDFREKEYLSKEVGTYKYTNAVGQTKCSKVWCRTSELLIGPDGHIFRCHADLYANRDWVGHILDEEVKFGGFRECNYYGKCNPCDVKLKTNRLQEGGHCSVEIKGVL
jgi:hypothetical protein